MGIEFRLTLDPAEPVAADLTRFGISTFAAAAMFALACYAPLRSLTAAALAGGIGWDPNHRNSGDRTLTLKRP
jgi:hypothetical protein